MKSDSFNSFPAWLGEPYMESPYIEWSLRVSVLRRGALQMGLPPARLEKCQTNHFSHKEFSNIEWSLQVVVLHRGALKMGLLPARLEKGRKNEFLYKDFTNIE